MLLVIIFNTTISLTEFKCDVPLSPPLPPSSHLSLFSTPSIPPTSSLPYFLCLPQLVEADGPPTLSLVLPEVSPS